MGAAEVRTQGTLLLLLRPPRNTTTLVVVVVSQLEKLLAVKVLRTNSCRVGHRMFIVVAAVRARRLRLAAHLMRLEEDLRGQLQIHDLLPPADRHHHWTCCSSRPVYCLRN